MDLSLLVRSKRITEWTTERTSERTHARPNTRTNALRHGKSSCPAYPTAVRLRVRPSTYLQRTIIQSTCRRHACSHRTTHARATHARTHARTRESSPWIMSCVCLHVRGAVVRPSVRLGPNVLPCDVRSVRSGSLVTVGGLFHVAGACLRGESETCVCVCVRARARWCRCLMGSHGRVSFVDSLRVDRWFTHIGRAQRMDGRKVL